MDLNLFDTLKEHSRFEYHTNPEQDVDIHRMEQEFNCNFPDDYKSIFNNCSSCNFSAQNDNINVWSLTESFNLMGDAFYAIPFTGMLIFGADGG